MAQPSASSPKTSRPDAPPGLQPPLTTNEASQHGETHPSSSSKSTTTSSTHLSEEYSAKHTSPGSKKPTQSQPQPSRQRQRTRYEHIKSKIDARLPGHFIPGESSFVHPRYRNSAVSDADVDAEAGRVLQGVDIVGTLREMTPVGSRSGSRYFVSAPRSSSPAPHNDADSGSDTDTDTPFPVPARPPTSSSTSRRRPELRGRSSSASVKSRRSVVLAEMPTSNEAGYAAGTDSFSRKRREGVEYGGGGERGSVVSGEEGDEGETSTSTSTSASKKEGRKVRFISPVLSPVAPGFPRYYAVSEGESEEEVGDNCRGDSELEGFRKAIIGVKNDLVPLRQGLLGDEEPLHRFTVDGKFPSEICALRLEVKELVECYYEEVGRMREKLSDTVQQQAEREEEVVRVREEMEDRLREVEGKSEASNKMREEEKGAYDRGMQELEGKLEDMEKDAGEQVRRHLEEAAQTAKAQAQKIKELEESAGVHDDQASRVKQLEETSKAQFQELESANQTIERQFEQLRLAVENHHAQAQEISSLQEALQEKQVVDALRTNTHTESWHPVYQRKMKVLHAQESEITLLKRSLLNLESYIPALETEAQALRTQNTAFRDANHTLTTQLAAARDWETEYRAASSMLAAQTAGEAEALATLRAEMHAAIAEYTARTPAPGTTPASHIAALERALDAKTCLISTSTARLEALKADKATALVEIKRLRSHTADLAREIEELKAGPEIPARRIVDERTGAVMHIPPWTLASTQPARRTALAELRAEQRAARETADLRSDVLERVRRWKMEGAGTGKGKGMARYPPGRPGYEGLVGRSGWERWEGGRWLEEVLGTGDWDDAVRAGLVREGGGGKGGGEGVRGLRNWSEEE